MSSEGTHQLQNANIKASTIVKTLSQISLYEGIMRILEMAASITLLGVTGKLTALLNSTNGAAVSLTTTNGTYIDISNSTTGANIAGLVTSIVTPVSHAFLGSWDSIAPKDTSPNVLSTLLTSSQLLQMGIWLGTAIWFTIEYGSWDCSNPLKLLEEYNQTSISSINTLTNGVGITFFSNNYTSFDYNTIGVNNSDILTIGLEDLFASLGVSQVTLSLLSSTALTDSQEIISALSKDCSLKKGAIGVSWTGVVFFIISTILMIIHYRQDSVSVSTTAAIPLSIKEPPNQTTTIPINENYNQVKATASLELITTTLKQVTMNGGEIESFSLQSSMHGYDDDFYISLDYSKIANAPTPSIKAETVPITTVSQSLTSSFSCNKSNFSPTIETMLWYLKPPVQTSTERRKSKASTSDSRWNRGIIPSFFYGIHFMVLKVLTFFKDIGDFLRPVFIGTKIVEPPGVYDLEFLEYIQYTIKVSSTDSTVVLLKVEGLKVPRATVQKLRQIQRSLKGRGSENTMYLASHALLLPKQVN